MLDRTFSLPDLDTARLEAEAAERGALPDAPLAMPRQRLERTATPALLARLRALLAPRLDA
ncbi:hypothetical protein CLV79_102220 [Limimaricola soesokkakensis]|uniref:Uncharacterized protein n=1 Tax=Limimaricola soesokkakensis TaxID=1343159 RepID=A0A1X6YWG6_9RHOB|nr:hypothetical protein [Limimaricola soesokkakensis]PSK87736.1 hypothetical protein CLV79_102220 [Limimaricola soesokkakensis]SLN33600.1 hypothetical protein LOS8367_01303 [Limimaricola soesokkakensis]